MEGAKSTGTFMAITIVVRRSSAMPLAIFPRIFAVAGAITIRSAISARVTCPILEPLKRRNISHRTGLPERVSKVRGETNC